MTDVYVPSVDKTWDFLVDENAGIDTVTKEIAEMVSLTLGTELSENGPEFVLYSADLEKALPAAGTLASCGIRNGDRLMLI